MKNLIKITYLVIYLIAFLACTEKEVKCKDVTALKDTSRWEKSFYETISKSLSAVKEKPLNDSVSPKQEFRCYYFPSFETAKFFKINFQDSSLLVREFTTKRPDGTGENKLLLNNAVKLSRDDFEKLDRLIERSHFWSLETVTYPYVTIDGVRYVYEYKEPIKPAAGWIKKGIT